MGVKTCIFLYIFSFLSQLDFSYPSSTRSASSQHTTTQSAISYLTQSASSKFAKDTTTPSSNICSIDSTNKPINIQNKSSYISKNCVSYNKGSNVSTELVGKPESLNSKSLRNKESSVTCAVVEVDTTDANFSLDLNYDSEDTAMYICEEDEEIVRCDNSSKRKNVNSYSTIDQQTLEKYTNKLIDTMEAGMKVKLKKCTDGEIQFEVFNASSIKTENEGEKSEVLVTMLNKDEEEQLEVSRQHKAAATIIKKDKKGMN